MQGSRPPPTSGAKRRFSGWLPVLALAAALTLLAVDFFRFVRLCRHYSDEAARGFAQLNEPPPPNEAIVVLTGGALRIGRAIDLLWQRRSAILIISGVSRGMTLNELMTYQEQEKEASIHFPEVRKKIFLESRATSTLENAMESGRILRDRKVRQAVLVTSDFHIPRALAMFRALNHEIRFLPYAVPSDFSELQLFPPKKWWHGSLKIGTEYLKFTLYAHYLARHFVDEEGTSAEQQ
jgi:uncharacterized SAM-binding protein YcdF (DUF218 family)